MSIENLFKKVENTKDVKISSERFFLEFSYPEMRDLLKHFLTLISGSLVFSTAFSDKVINFATSTEFFKTIALGGWGLLIVALGLCGISIFSLYLAAEKALKSELIITSDDYKVLMKLGIISANISGISYGVGLSILLVVAVLSR